jgi:murein DD-endopeptidase MepM/ murein hydrolase activator NlpD
LINKENNTKGRNSLRFPALRFSQIRVLKLRMLAPLLMASMVAMVVGLVGHISPFVDFDTEEQVARPGFSLSFLQSSSNENHKGEGEAESGQPSANPVASIAPQAPAMPESYVRTVALGKGDTLFELLIEADIERTVANEIVANVKKIYDVKKMRAGQEIALEMVRQGNEESLTGLSFQPDSLNEVSVSLNEKNQFQAKLIETPIERKRFAKNGTVNSSLSAAGQLAGLPKSIVSAMIRIYSHEIDFQRELKSGDTFEVLYDQSVTPEGKSVGEGTILYANLKVGGRSNPLYRVTFADGTVDYFDEKGQSIKKGLLRTPVDGARVTSRFGMRNHPILGYSKMHKGVDFGAPTGTPIYAAGDGTIAEVGFKGAYGRYVRIRHNNGLATAYAHMSRFGRGIQTGKRVEQGDVIGYVGSTGRSTGPHLHYEVLVAGRQVNPLGVKFNTGRKLDGKMLTEFKRGQKSMQGEYANLLEGRTPVVVASSAPPAPPLLVTK